MFINKRGECLKALDDISFEVDESEFVVLVGPSGCGKSTLLNIIGGLEKATEGSVTIDERRVTGPGADRGMVFQGYSLFPWLNVRKNVEFGLKMQGVSKAEREEKAKRYLEMVGLSGFEKALPKELSGGMKQRALLAQALLGKPEVIILDEPTAGVDPKERIQMRNIISQVGFGCIILIATHVVPDVQFIAKEILLLGKGRIIESGTPSSLQKKMEGKVFEITTDEENFRELSRKYRTVQMARNEDAVTLRVVSDEIPGEVPFVNVRPDLEDLYLYHFDEEHHL